MKSSGNKIFVFLLWLPPVLVDSCFRTGGSSGGEVPVACLGCRADQVELVVGETTQARGSTPLLGTNGCLGMRVNCDVTDLNNKYAIMYFQDLSPGPAAGKVPIINADLVCSAAGMWTFTEAGVTKDVTSVRCLIAERCDACVNDIMSVPGDITPEFEMTVDDNGCSNLVITCAASPDGQVLQQFNDEIDFMSDKDEPISTTLVCGRNYLLNGATVITKVACISSPVEVCDACVNDIMSVPGDITPEFEVTVDDNGCSNLVITCAALPNGPILQQLTDNFAFLNKFFSNDGEPISTTLVCDKNGNYLLNNEDVITEAACITCQACKADQVALVDGDDGMTSVTPTATTPVVDANGCSTMKVTCDVSDLDNKNVMMQFQDATPGPAAGNVPVVNADLVCSDAGTWQFTEAGVTKDVTAVNCKILSRCDICTGEVDKGLFGDVDPVFEVVTDANGCLNMIITCPAVPDRALTLLLTFPTTEMEFDSEVGQAAVKTLVCFEGDYVLDLITEKETVLIALCSFRVD